jgi:hypothetical protein
MTASCQRTRKPAHGQAKASLSSESRVDGRPTETGFETITFFERSLLMNLHCTHIAFGRAHVCNGLVSSVSFTVIRLVDWTRLGQTIN